MKFLVFIFNLFIVLFFTNCSKLEEEKNNYDISIRNSELANFNSSFIDFWNQAFSDLTLDVICSCDCNNMIRKVEYMQDNLQYFPSYFQNYRFRTNPDSCNYLTSVIGGSCGVVTASLIKNKIDGVSITNKPFSNEEKILFKEIVDSVFTYNKLNINFFKTKWNKLSTQSVISNQSSRDLIALLDANQQFLYGTTIFDIDDEPEIEATKIFNILLGYFGSMIVATIWDVIETGGDGDKSKLTAEQVHKAGLQGAATGALS